MNAERCHLCGKGIEDKLIDGVSINFRVEIKEHLSAGGIRTIHTCLQCANDLALNERKI